MGEKNHFIFMDRGHDGTQETNYYSPLGIIVQFPVRVTSFCESLVRCALPTRPQQRDARTCVHVRRVEQTTLEGAGETTPRLIFVVHAHTCEHRAVVALWEEHNEQEIHTSS